MRKNDLMWYREPAVQWDEALPLGNGRLGAMIFGDPHKELMQLNEDSIWYGGPMHRINPSALPNMKAVQKFILEERIEEAEELLKYSYVGTPLSMRPYQLLGWVHLTMRKQEENYSEYMRRLSLSEAVHQVEYMCGGVKYQRETLITAPDQVIAVHLTSDRKGAVSFVCMIERDRFLDWSGEPTEGVVMIKGSSGEQSVYFCAALSVSVKGGSIKVLGENVVVDDADEATLYIASETSYYHGEAYENKALERLQMAIELGYDEIRKRHVRDYQSLYNRLRLSLGEDKYPLETTADRLKKLSECHADNDLLVTYFNFGRYLLISSSRPGTLPANLQGIWNDKMNPRWDSKFTININTQMNYWPAEVCNLSECHLPLFDLLQKMQESGHEVAEKMYGCRGFVAHHNTDLWGDCAPQDLWIPGTFWPMGGAWLCLHIWEHYQYCRDEEWLSTMYDVIRDSVLFFEDFLIEHEGQLLTCPSVSPENSYIMKDGTKGSVTSGPTMDNEILRELIRDFLKISEILGIEDEVTKKAREIPEKLPPLQIGKYGQIMEWRTDFEENEPGHRHFSHLFGLYPGHEITVDKTPLYAKAAEKALRRRVENGSGYAGFSCAWVISLFASLRNGEESYRFLLKLLHDSTHCNLMDTNPSKPVGTSIFQIDGNLGATAAMIHMLMQATEEQIRLLPALPEAWTEGKLEGVCVPGKAEMNFAWTGGRLKEADITAHKAGIFKVVYNELIWEKELKEGETAKII